MTKKSTLVMISCAMLVSGVKLCLAQGPNDTIATEAFHQDHHFVEGRGPHPMSREVILRRLQMLGFQNTPKLIKSGEGYRASGLVDGQAVIWLVNEKSGDVRDARTRVLISPPASLRSNIVLRHYITLTRQNVGTLGSRPYVRDIVKTRLEP